MTTASRIFRVCLRNALVRACPPITTAELPEAAAAPLAHALTYDAPPWGAGWEPALHPAPLLLPPWPLAHIPEHIVMGINVLTLAGAIQNASVTHHGTPDAARKQLPRDGEQPCALRAVQEAKGGGDGCGTRWGTMRGTGAFSRLFLAPCTCLRPDTSPLSRGTEGGGRLQRGWGGRVGCGPSHLRNSDNQSSRLCLFQKEIIWGLRVWGGRADLKWRGLWVVSPSSSHQWAV